MNFLKFFGIIVATLFLTPLDIPHAAIKPAHAASCDLADQIVSACKQKAVNRCSAESFRELGEIVKDEKLRNDCEDFVARACRHSLYTLELREILDRPIARYFDRTCGRYGGWLTNRQPKAQAMAEDGSAAYVSTGNTLSEAKSNAVRACNREAERGRCKIIAFARYGMQWTYVDPR